MIAIGDGLLKFVVRLIREPVTTMSLLSLVSGSGSGGKTAACAAGVSAVCGAPVSGAVCATAGAANARAPRIAADDSAVDELKLNLRIVWPLLRNIAAQSLRNIR
ncbi:MAG: hypothetical protein V4472_07975 [Pseudomonadota bacterium]